MADRQSTVEGMVKIMLDFSFYKGKKVLITGHTGFKGSWLSLMLYESGAEVVGYALRPENDESIYKILELDKKVVSYYEDIRDYNALSDCIEKEKPEIVFHLAAQPIVRESYRRPLYTYECNMMGTVNVLESIRLSDYVHSFLNVTTDKVYQNNEWEWGYRETERLDGYDPYSNSKSCSELITATYKRALLDAGKVAVSTVRAGNVIGGGDFAKDRIIPDSYRAASENEPIIVRNPNSVRPYQHVIEPLTAYMMIVQKQCEHSEYSNCFNVGPEDADCISTGLLTKLFCDCWGNNQSWRNLKDEGPHEANFLKLDCSVIKKKIGWKPQWKIETAIRKTVDWYQEYRKHVYMYDFTKTQVFDYWEQFNI